MAVPKYALFGFLILLLIFLTPPVLAWQQDSEALRQEEQEDYYDKWLRQDVIHIITDEEKEVFQSLTTDEEKERFIEQFWFRRDPDPRTPENEFKTEHYRRIAYANEHFSSGFDGWQVDRGRVYIIHGPPDQIDRYPMGRQYDRPMHEGGGSTMTYPYEVWRYRNIPGVGTDVILEFVDPSGTGEYHLALHPEEKDAFLRIPGLGRTFAEEHGLATRADHPYLSGGSRTLYPMMAQRLRDSPFQRYETYSRVQGPREIKYKDLKEIVDIDVDYSQLPVELHQDYFRLNEDQVLVPITLKVENEDLSFKNEGDQWVAKVAIYGAVTSLSNRLITEFEDDLVVSYGQEELEAALSNESVYQKIITLDRKTRYKLSLVAQDLNEKSTASVQKAIQLPTYSEDKLEASSLLLADFIQPLESVPDEDEMFVLGDVKVRPRVGAKFFREAPLGIYLQLYNVEIDQTTYEPSLAITYRILNDGKVMAEHTDRKGESTQFFSAQRVVLVKGLSLRSLEPGHYKIQVEVEDQLDEESLTLSQDFEVVES